MEDTIESLAFSEDQVSTLTGLSKRQLRYWDRRHHFFSPEYKIEGRPLYSFRDVVGLRTVAQVRDRLPLQQLRKIDARLHSKYETPWASLKFFLAGRELIYAEPDSGTYVSAKYPGQEVVQIDLEEVRAEMISDLARLRKRSQDQIGKISRNRNVMRGASVVAGTRIPTAIIWRYHEAGFSNDKILEGFPRLTISDVKTAISHEKKRRRRKRAG